ncbi:hypothetical protein J2S35_000864 [Falsarthrobacter nasiphocae]|uniref:Uncharacterized protein n=1 Tax=Falsarthrobacter nasiphocae TaxID=189863 RepID=A0AAE4C6Y1_9MICC|nr:hypothetical protein [Falsarthrobacter nasiphocae]
MHMRLNCFHKSVDTQWTSAYSGGIIGTHRGM